VDTPEAAKDEQQRDDHQRLNTEDDNRPTGAENRDLTGTSLIFGISPAGGTGWRWRMPVDSV